MDVRVLLTPASAHEGPLCKANFIQENKFMAFGRGFMNLLDDAEPIVIELVPGIGWHHLFLPHLLDLDSILKVQSP
jgi:hypothetical protein